MTSSQIKEIKTHLVQELNSLAGQADIHVPAVENCPDDTDFASQLAQHGVNIAMQRRRVKRLQELEAALKRLSETEYGICEECGDSIGVARLKANPSARLCIHCQSEIEEATTGRCA